MQRNKDLLFYGIYRERARRKDTVLILGNKNDQLKITKVKCDTDIVYFLRNGSCYNALKHRTGGGGSHTKTY